MEDEEEDEEEQEEEEKKKGIEKGNILVVRETKQCIHKFW